MFKNAFSFNGRIRRLEYGLSLLIYNIVSLIGYLAMFASGDYMTLVFLLFMIPIAWFMLAQGAKRCHDRGNNGFWQLIPFYGLWMLFGSGEIGPNEYGGNPKGLNYQLLGQNLDFKGLSDTQAVYNNGEEDHSVEDEVDNNEIENK